MHIDEPAGMSPRRVPRVEAEVVGISKWYDGHRSAYSPTYDTPYLDGPEIAWLREEGLFVDFEVITDLYDRHPGKMDTLRSLVPEGFGYFGHGHLHIDHDALDSAAAYASFRLNFEAMRAGGLKPVSYAYPGGFGWEAETHGALKAAGFLSGRLARQWFDPEPWQPPHVMSGEEKEPRNWYALPALYMQDIAWENCKACVNNPAEFAEFLHNSVEAGAWLISVYHAIGWDGKGQRPRAWGFYDLENFYAEMRLARKLRDQGLLWIAGMDAVTLYTYERNAASWTLKRKGAEAFDLTVTHALDKKRFDHPLTVILKFSNASGKRLRIHHPSRGDLGEKDVTAQPMLVNLTPSDTAYRLTIL